MPETSGYRDVIEECFHHKLTRENYVDSCKIFFNETVAHTFAIYNKDSPRKVRSALKAFMKNYYSSIKDIKITSEAEHNGVEVVFEVYGNMQFELRNSFRAIYDGVKYEAEEAEAVLENAKSNL